MLTVLSPARDDQNSNGKRTHSAFLENTELGVISVDSNWIVVSGAEGGSRTRTSFRTTDFKSRDRRHYLILRNDTSQYLRA